MARGIVWTNYLQEEALFRFWYLLENNNFKSAIKNAQKEGKMSYSIAHNALYAGLYYPQNPYTYGDRVLVNIKEERELKKSATIANFMQREEILENIHAMYECATMIRDYSPYGYNAVMFTKEFFNIGRREKEKSNQTKIDAKLLYFATANENELTPNKPNRYRLAKNFAKTQAANLEYNFKNSSERNINFDGAMQDYKNNNQQLNDTLVLNGITDLKKREKLINSVTCGFYRTVLPHYGLSIKGLTETSAPKELITSKELVTLSQMLIDATEVAKQNKDLPLNELADKLKQSGEKSREAFVKQNKTYPETKKGFMNAFCEMLAKAYVYDETILEEGLGRSMPDVIEKILKTMTKLKEEFAQNPSGKEKEELTKQVTNIQKALEGSNTHNI